MNPKDNEILSGDGRRFTVNENEATGSENPSEGLAFEAGNITATEANESGNKRTADNKEEQDGE